MTILRLRQNVNLTAAEGVPTGIAAKGYPWQLRIVSDLSVNMKIAPNTSTASLTFTDKATAGDQFTVDGVTFEAGAEYDPGLDELDTALAVSDALILAGFDARLTMVAGVVEIHTTDPQMTAAEVVDADSVLTVVDFTQDDPVTGDDPLISEDQPGVLFSVASDESVLVLSTAGEALVGLTEVGTVGQ